MKKVGEVKLGDFKIPVLTSPYVDKDHVYLLNPEMTHVVARFDGFKPYTFRAKVRDYFKNLWKAIKGKA